MMIGDMPDLLASRALLSGEAIALEELATGETRTYAELDARAGKVAALLAARGIGAGDRVAVLCRQRIAFFELLFGCAKLGAILVPLNWRMPAAELDGLIADAGPSLLFHDAADAATVAALAAPPPIIDLDSDYGWLVTAAGEAAGRAHWPADGILYLLYTSGTTGRPKGVIYTYRMALANHVNIGTAIGLTSRDTTVAFLPNFHTAGINLHALPTLFSGGRVLLMAAFDPDAMIALLGQGRIDTLFGVPTIYQSLLDQPAFASLPLDRVRHWGCGGAALPDALALRCRDAGMRVCNGMGMTETGPTAFLLDPADAWDRIGSVGKPQLLCAARIVDIDGAPVADGEIGEVQFSGPGITPGYWRDEAATAAAFTPDGWLRSGDLARRDADGFAWIAGRRKEMFISGGENVYPAEVENVLAACPGVVDVAVLPRPDPKWGEVGRAFVQLAPDGRPDEAALTAFCRSRLAPYKVPAAFEFVAEFPRTSAGKIRKHLLA
ncbi:class I adenylate-forming enzyme family protein [Sphingosinicella sp.]|uniref:class I adenylate-forming enzyme family protein n=1 Tax=Sphingosinicella sp. TaxID=1917971 RepID=UPI004037D707